jgi:hypothetical protein
MLARQMLLSLESLHQSLILILIDFHPLTL